MDGRVPATYAPATHARSSQFYLVDGLGSTSELSDASGGIQVSYKYDAWGNLLQTQGSSDNPKQFTGQDFDGAEDRRD